MRSKNLTLRLPESVYRLVAEQKRGTTTRYIVEAIEEKLSRDREEGLRKGFSTLAGEPDEETKQWVEAQRESMRRVDA